MSSTTSHALSGDPKKGGALFQLPREVRDIIYRFVHKDYYQVVPSRLYMYIGDRKAKPEFSILRVSKIFSGEAAKILYSKSVFRFALANIDFALRENGFLDDEDADHVKKFAPMMKNVILDINGMSIEWRGHILNGLMRQAIDLFGGIENRRRSLRVRILSCTDWLVGREMGSFCQQLKELVGYRAAVVEVYSSLWELRMSAYRALEDEARSERITNSVSRIMVAVTEELEPSFGPAISSFKLQPGNAPVLNEKPLILGDTVLVGYLKFRPGKHIDGKDIEVEVEDRDLHERAW